MLKLRRSSTLETTPPAQQPTFLEEVRSITTLAKQIGLRPPLGMPATVSVYGFGNAYIADEGKPIEETRNDQTFIDFFVHEAYPALQELEANGDPSYRNLGTQVGRAVASAILGHHMPVELLGMHFDGDIAYIDGAKVSMEEPETVMEFGIGITGLTRHFANLAQDTYQLIAIQRDERENHVLAGMAERVGGNVILLHGGMVNAVGELLAQSDPPRPDVVIASRVHMAGPELLDGIRLAGELMLDGSLLIARGPDTDKGHREIAQFIGYREVLAAIDANPAFEVIDAPVVYTDHNGVPATSFVAERIA